MDNLYEIRLRKNFPIKIKYEFRYCYLTKQGISLLSENAIICNDEMINDIINNVSDHSIYSYNDQIQNGYITTCDGIRIGIAGECVFENGKIITIKNFQSLNIRIPHNIYGCADYVYGKIFQSNIFNTLIVSPPFYGKTTLLKDLI